MTSVNFPPFLLLAWVCHLYLQFPAPCSQDLSSMTPQILCLNSLLFNFSVSPSPVFLSSNPTISCHHASESKFPPPPLHGITRHTLPPKIQLRKSSTLPSYVLTVEATPWKNNWGESPLSHQPPAGELSSLPGSGAVAQLLTVLECSACFVLRASSASTMVKPSTILLPSAHSLSIVTKL